MAPGHYRLRKEVGKRKPLVRKDLNLKSAEDVTLIRGIHYLYR